MAFRDFWMGVRIGARRIAAADVIDAPRLEPVVVEARLCADPSWLTPRTVAGFDEADFGFLSEPERTRLKDLVEQFRAVAASVRRGATPDADAVAKALPPFLGIVDALEFDRYGDAEAFQSGKRIEQDVKDDWPEGLAQLRFKTGTDHMGDPGIWIWGFLTDEASATDDRFLETSRKLRRFLQPVAETLVPDRWPFLFFRSLREENEPAEAR